MPRSADCLSVQHLLLPALVGLSVVGEVMEEGPLVSGFMNGGVLLCVVGALGVASAKGRAIEQKGEVVLDASKFSYAYELKFD